MKSGNFGRKEWVRSATANVSCQLVLPYGGVRFLQVYKSWTLGSKYVFITLFLRFPQVFVEQLPRLQ